MRRPSAVAAVRAALVAIAALVAVAALVALVALAAAPQSARPSGIDLTAMDPSVRPQDDFYRYVNGGWLDSTEIPPDKPAYGAFTEVADRTEIDVRQIIEDAAAAPNRRPGTVSQQVGDLFTSFMDESRVERLGARPLEPVLADIDRIASARGLAVELGTLAAIGVAGFNGGYIEPDAKKPSVPVVYLEQGGTALPDRDYYLVDDPAFRDARDQYVAYLEKIFALVNRRDPAGDARAVLHLETALAGAQWTQVETRDALKTYNPFTLAEMSSRMPGFDWKAWAEPQGLERSPGLVVQEPSFFKAFAALVPATPLATWKAWLAAEYISMAAPLLSRDFVDANFEFFGRVLSGQQEQRPRWKRGVSLVNRGLGEAVGKLYVDRHFPAAAKTRMQRMVADLLEAYRRSIGGLDWMTSATRKAALEKLSKVTTKIGYPDTWRDYSGLTIEADDLLGNFQRAQRFENDYQIGKLGQPVDPTEWLMTPQTINAYYNPVRNEIVFPAAILQPPFFDTAADAAVNYGGIGAVIGHEIGHAFDDQGRHYDGDGRLRDWWTPRDVKQFNERAAKLVAQYDALSPIDDLHVNGELTLGENIGDLGGLSIAWKAYHLALGGRPAPELDGFTGDQRLFIGWARVWRARERDEYLRQILLSNPHAPDRYRATIPPSNIDAFYAAFDVKPGDRMWREPGERVTIW